MVTKFLIVATALMAVAMASVIPAPAAVAYAPGQLVRTEEYDPVPQYTYAYDVQDTITGDTKSQQETRNGDVVTGSYSFIEADGTRRLVEYTADPINGFNAVVHREPAVVRAVPVAPVAPLVAAPAPLHRFHH